MRDLNWKLGNWKFFIFIIRPYLKVVFFLFEVIFLVFGFSVSYTAKNWSKRKFSEISKISISGIGQNQKLGNLGIFFLVMVIFKVLFPIFFYLEFLLVKYMTRNVKNPKKRRKLGNFNPCSLIVYSRKMETNLLILILIRKENLKGTLMQIWKSANVFVFMWK